MLRVKLQAMGWRAQVWRLHLKIGKKMLGGSGFGVLALLCSYTTATKCVPRAKAFMAECPAQSKKHSLILVTVFVDLA